MYTVDVSKQLAYESINTKTTGALMVFTYKIQMDNFGAYIYIPRKKKKVYLNHNNCVKIN